MRTILLSRVKMLSPMVTVVYAPILITSAKEVMFLPEFVCLSVCVSKITQKVRKDLSEIFRECRE